jgi:hypothetical protein
MIIVDTNVLSEVIRSAPEERVAAWFEAQDRGSTFSTVINRAEMLAGVEILPSGRRKDVLHALVTELFETQFGQSLLSFDVGAADSYAQVVAARRRSGLPIGIMDAQIAAIARVHGAAIATRDVDGFTGIGIELINPWAV